MLLCTGTFFLGLAMGLALLGTATPYWRLYGSGGALAIGLILISASV